jgi:CRP-like cAMP-binding protein
MPADYRTKEQIARLRVVLNKLRCLKRFHPNDRFKLAECAYFNYYNQNRTILREGHHPSAVYFILHGEVNVLKEKWDSVNILIFSRTKR